MPDRLSPFTVSLSFGLAVALADFVVSASVSGLWITTLPWVTTPLAGFAAIVSLTSLAGWGLGFVAARLSPSLDGPTAGFAAATAVAVLWSFAVLGWTTPSWAATAPRTAVFWGGMFLAFALASYRVLERGPSWSERLLSAATLTVAAASALQLLRHWIDWTSRASTLAMAAVLLAAGAGILAWALRTGPRSARAAVLVLASAVFAAPLVPKPGFPGDAEPVLAAGAGKPKRVLLITIDTLRRDALGVYSGRPDSPAIDELAEEAIVFDHARSPAPWTYPAMTSLMTGVGPAVHGVTDRIHRMPGRIRTLAERLREAGLVTAGVGYNFFLTRRGSGWQMPRGFADYRMTPIQPRPGVFGFGLANRVSEDAFNLDFETPEIAQMAAKWLRQRGDGSFFLWVHFFDPHAPFAPPSRYAPQGEPHPRIGIAFTGQDLRDFRGGDLEVDRQMIKWIRALYQAEVRTVDEQIGMLLDVLRELEIYDSTYVALTSDHGDEFLEHGGMDHGHTQFEELLRVPLILKPPGLDSPRRIETRVSTVALAPTILNALGIPYDPEEFSASALPLHANQPQSRTAFYSAGILHGNQLVAVAFDRYKYILAPGRGMEWLYDLEVDPGERRNLVGTEVQALETARALLSQREAEATERRRRLGVEAAPSRPLDEGQKELLKSLGYIQ